MGKLAPDGFPFGAYFIGAQAPGGRKGRPHKLRVGVSLFPAIFSFVGADAFIRPFLLPGRHRNVGPMWASAPTAWLEATSKNRESMRIHDWKQRRSIEKEQADWLALSAAW